MTCSDTAFARQFKRTGVPNLLRQFGETVAYYAGGAGTGRSIKAIVERSPMAGITAAEFASQAITVRVANQEGCGISSSEIDTASDEISVSLRVGADAQRRSVSRVMSDNGGFLTLVVI